MQTTHSKTNLNSGWIRTQIREINWVCWFKPATRKAKVTTKILCCYSGTRQQFWASHSSTNSIQRLIGPKMKLLEKRVYRFYQMFRTMLWSASSNSKPMQGNNVKNHQQDNHYVASLGRSVSHNNGWQLQTNQKQEWLLHKYPRNIKNIGEYLMKNAPNATPHQEQKIYISSCCQMCQMN